MIVVDTNVIAAFWIPLASTRSEASHAARRHDPDWIAPALWRSEFRSVLRKYMTAGELSIEDAITIAESAERDLRKATYDVSTADVLMLVHETGHSAYDCEYIALARALDLHLLTADERIVRQFPDTAVLLDDTVP